MEHQQDPVVIVGGGIGGLSAALALVRVGVPVRVFEQAPELAEVGAGIGLWTNAVRALDHLGVGDAIRRVSTALSVGEFCNPQGDVLSGFDLGALLPDMPGAAVRIIHRAGLQGALADALPPGVLTTGAVCTGVTQDADGVTVTFDGDDPVRASLLIGADGIDSAVRAALHGKGKKRYSGQTAYRGIAEVPPPEPGVVREIQGPGMRAAVCPIDATRVYWWTAENAPEGQQDKPEERRAYLLDRFRGWPGGLPELIAATTSPILRNDLVDRAPLDAWTVGRVTLLGDAAHPMLPNLGQGACSAIEDGVVLGQSIAAEGVTPAALQRYERARMARTTRFVKDSWVFGIPVLWKRAPAVFVREWLLKLTPESIFARTVRSQIGFDVGPLPASVAGR